MLNYQTEETEKLYNYIVSEAKKPFEGWDFSYINERMVIEPLNWNYVEKILLKMRKAKTLLDMGTGGGKFLYDLKPLPPQIYATEVYRPNIPVARKRLEPIGVKIIEIDGDDNLPFESNFFDLVINRHEAYSVKEVYRILKPGCQFITQQVDGINNLGLNKLLGADESIGMDYWNLEYAVGELKNAGFKVVEKYEQKPILKFYDMGAIVYYLKAIPWQILDFNIDKYFDALVKIHKTIKNKGLIEIESHRFFIIAEKAS